ncbi:DUF1836 domain-containing protein [Zongyangia hominis]|uniref:DUF1836 domain-containing protein n=1 Tax=Zongyangia hominis TaxID=2763677 RepID=A0A926EG83_9FIRM|nr:DUF1836 domain-containing protein [Zongyangia hominis]MBC8571122.1 DUF1836 domain-containing protein [Zongyangia hominis]
MDINNEQVMKAVEQAVETSDLAPWDIPNIDLYMDQVITIFEDTLRGNKRREEDKLLTKTMINNYSKAGIVQPVKGKKYSKDHILQMLLIYNLKQTLSISDIERLTQGLQEDGQLPEHLAEIYEEFLEEKKKQRTAFTAQFSEDMKSAAPIKTHTDLYKIVLSLCSMSNFLKLAAERIIDDYFDVPQKRAKEK